MDTQLQSSVFLVEHMQDTWGGLKVKVRKNAKKKKKSRVFPLMDMKNSL